jgi:hypothetical protein
VPECEGEAWLDCTAAMCDGFAGRGDQSIQLTRSFPLVGHERHSLWSRHALACARSAASVKAGRSAASHCGVALTLTMAGRRLVVVLVGDAPSQVLCFTMAGDSCENGAWGTWPGRE